MVNVMEMDDRPTTMPDMRRRRDDYDRDRDRDRRDRYRDRDRDRDRRSRRHNDERDRDRHRKRRRRYSSDSETESDDGFKLGSWKTLAVFGVIGLCFAILYPKMFHPMLMYVIYGKQEEKATDPKYPHPGMRGRGGPPPGRGPMPGGPPPNMGAHAAGETRTSGRSWHWMLPFYSVGVIVFLLYTLSKILWRKPKSRRGNRYGVRYNSRRDRFEVPGVDNGFDDESDEESDESPIGRTGRLKKRELKGLQGRLLQTESAMQKILEQLETLQGAVDDQTAQQIRQSTMETLETMANTEKKAKKLRERTDEYVDENSEEEEEEASDEEQRSSSRRGNRRELKGTARYLGDLEKALSDFRTLTESYVQTKAGEAMQKAVEEELSMMQSAAAAGQENAEATDGQTAGTSMEQQQQDRPANADSADENHSDGRHGHDDASEAEADQQQAVRDSAIITDDRREADADEDSDLEADSDDRGAGEAESSEASNEEEESEDRGFDVMEAEEHIRGLPDPVGEIIPMKDDRPMAAVQQQESTESETEADTARSGGVRKRKPRRQRRE